MSQPQSPREHIAAWWSDAWSDGLWAASWAKSIDGLSASQAAWTPPAVPGASGTRHSIWQIVLHMIFWREVWLRRVATGVRPTEGETAAGNFPPIAEPTEIAWEKARLKFADTQTRIAELLASADPAADPIVYFLPHDCYHFGQINYLRAMLGLKPIE